MLLPVAPLSTGFGVYKAAGRPQGLRCLALTFRVLVFPAVVHTENKGLKDEGHNDGHHHLTREQREGQQGLCKLAVPAAPVIPPLASWAQHHEGRRVWVGEREMPSAGQEPTMVTM